MMAALFFFVTPGLVSLNRVRFHAVFAIIACHTATAWNEEESTCVRSSSLVQVPSVFDVLTSAIKATSSTSMETVPATAPTNVSAIASAVAPVFATSSLEPVLANAPAVETVVAANVLEQLPATAPPVLAAVASEMQKPAARISPFGREDVSRELQTRAAKTQDTLVDAVENAEVAEIKRSVFRALTRLRAAEIKEFDTIARLQTQAIDDFNDRHHYLAENPLEHIHDSEPRVSEDKYSSFH
eukprot:TRINITY_DN52600_c0_g1_i1.p1 TRINITY_DN52600_c0_g1~~TRINITY_DN52600_c0_g1_i1.p1  ORF type:complete len:242 (+),score=38.95 TRINITY_DN52600_c0_g1_i1:61-786(+)